MCVVLGPETDSFRMAESSTAKADTMPFKPLTMDGRKMSGIPPNARLVLNMLIKLLFFRSQKY